MPLIRLINSAGHVTEIHAAVGSTVMQAAIDAGVTEILADCGGNCSCGTCHGYVDPAWSAHFAAPMNHEQELLDGVLFPQANSRLTCQLQIGPEHDGLVVHLPAAQV